eukprot:7129970-Pyramimonas_sp.AAC.1
MTAVPPPEARASWHLWGHNAGCCTFLLSVESWWRPHGGGAGRAGSEEGGVFSEKARGLPEDAFLKVRRCFL